MLCLRIPCLLALSVALLGACKATGAPDPSPAESLSSRSASAEGPIARPLYPSTPMEDLARGSTSAIQDLRLACIRSVDQWVAFWGEHAAHTLPASSPPEVDWEVHQVVALVLGQRSSGGYGVVIDSVEEGPQGLVVVAHEDRPQPGSATTMALTSPFHFVRVGRSEALERGVDLRMKR